MFDVHDQTAPRIKQISIFLENRLGALLPITRILEGHDIHVCAIDIRDGTDYAVVRLVVDRPTLAEASLTAEGYKVFLTDLLGVAMPHGRGIGIRKILTALLMAELNVHYVYAVVTHSRTHDVVAVHVEDMDRAAEMVKQHGLQLISQDDLP
ncbi:MAG: hypothetical protein ACYTCU_01645 [Planctomycetota bacterium]|jgi:hypothetical protein